MMDPSLPKKLSVNGRMQWARGVTTETPRAFEVLRRDVGYAMQFDARSILYVDYKPFK